jgi:hypothetical protein
VKVALVVTWNDAKAGLELEALAYTAEVADLWEKEAAAGNCTPPEILLSPVTTQGTWFVKGEGTVIEQLLERPESRSLLARGEALLDHFRWEIQLADESAQEFLVEYAKALHLVTS